MKSYVATLDPNCGTGRSQRPTAPPPGDRNEDSGAGGTGGFSRTAAHQFAEGVILADGTRCEPAELEILEPLDTPDRPTLVRVKLHEGKFHQVKKMLGAVGGCVVALHREAVGSLSLGDLPVGQTRNATAAEMEVIGAMLPPDAALRGNSQRRGVPGTGVGRRGKSSKFDPDKVKGPELAD